MPQGAQHYNFQMRLLYGRLTLMEQTISVPHKTAYDIMVHAKLPGTNDKDGVEKQVCNWIFDLERSINAGLTHPFRCHIDELPPDVPLSVQMEDEAIK